MQNPSGGYNPIVPASKEIPLQRLVVGRHIALLCFLFLCVTLAFLTVTSLYAQPPANTDGIQLILIDEHGNAVPHAKVTVTSHGINTHVRVTGETDSTGTFWTGTFSIDPVPFGEYLVEVAAKGFETLEKGVLVNQAAMTGVRLKAIAGNENVFLSMMDDLPSTALWKTLPQTITLGEILGLPYPPAAQQQPPAATQNMQGVMGWVTDHSLVPVPNAKVTLTNTATGAIKTDESSVKGDFLLFPPPPGNYNIEVVAKGFQRLLEKNIKFESGQSVGVILKLTPEGESKPITITTPASPYDVSKSNIGDSINNEHYSSTPQSTAATTTAQPTGTPTPERIAALLHSAEARDRAWGAYYAVQTKDATFLPELVRMAEQWEPLPPHHDPTFPDYKPDPTLEPAQVDHLDAMTAVLDAVILLDGRVSAQGLLNLQGDFSAQVAVLLSRMPEPEVESTLLTMVHDADPQHGARRHVAAELLAREQNPPAGFVASLMRGADVEGDATVQVPVPSKPGSSFGGASSCESDIWLNHPEPSDWPNVGQYSLSTTIDKRNATSYRIAGRILALRVEGTRTKVFPYCYPIGDLDTRARLQIVAELLDRVEIDLVLHPIEKTAIVATGTAEYERELREFVAQEEEKFSVVEKQLQRAGWVTADEVARGDAKPRLHLTVIDMRVDEDKKFALPRIDFHDSRIDWGVSEMRYWPLPETRSRPY